MGWLIGVLMPHYPKYTTTVIGAYSVPRWYEPLDRLVTTGQLLPEDMTDAQYRIMQCYVYGRRSRLSDSRTSRFA